jgi:hypothetical protein
VARHAVRPMLYGWGFRNSDWLNNAELVVSELVGNAVRHGGGCLSMDLQARRNTSGAGRGGAAGARLAAASMCSNAELYQGPAHEPPSP